MKALKRLLITLLIIVLVLAIALFGGYFFVRQKYGVDLFKTASQLKTLSADVDEGALCPNAFTDADMVDVQTEVNKSVQDLISYSEENGYVINFDNLPSSMLYLIRLSDRQVGALAQTVLEQELGGKTEVQGKEIGIALKQIEFSATEDGTLFNAVVQLDISAIKADMGGFPFSLFKKYVPDSLYISSTVLVQKGAEAFSYTATHRALSVNHLGASDTEDLFHTLDLVTGIGSAEDLNEAISSALLGVLIGGEGQTGFAYALKDVGATDYDFLQEMDGVYFAVKMGEGALPQL